MGDPSPTRIDAERNRRGLLDAAANALAKDSEASLSEIARLAGLTRATLYRHFGSREKLVGALRDDALTAAEEAIHAACVEEGTAPESLRRVIAALTSLGGRFWPLLMEGADRDPDFLRRRGQVFAPVLDIVQQGQVSGQIRSEVSAQWVVMALTALLAAAVRQARGFEDGDTAEGVFRILAFGITQPPPGKN